MTNSKAKGKRWFEAAVYRGKDPAIRRRDKLAQLYPMTRIQQAFAHPELERKKRKSRSGGSKQLGFTA